MRTRWQDLITKLGPQLTRDIVLVCLAAGIVGITFGAITVAAGLPVWLPSLLSVVVFAGAAQFLFVAIVAAGGGPVAAFAAGLLVNARHLPFAISLGDSIGPGWLRRIIGSHIITDEATAFTLAQTDPERRRAAFWASGILMFVLWNIGVAIGAVGGSVIDDTDAFGMDAALPAVLLALVMPALRHRVTRIAALVGAVLAVVLTPLLPAGLPVLLSLAALPIVMIGARRKHPPAQVSGQHEGAETTGQEQA